MKLERYERDFSPSAPDEKWLAENCINTREGRLISTNGVHLSMSRKGDPRDNSMMESLFSSLKMKWQAYENETRKDAELDVSTYIEMFHNGTRLRESLNHVSPLDFERNFDKNSLVTEMEVHAQ